MTHSPKTPPPAPEPEEDDGLFESFQELSDSGQPTRKSTAVRIPKRKLETNISNRLNQLTESIEEEGDPTLADPALAPQGITPSGTGMTRASSRRAKAGSGRGKAGGNSRISARLHEMSESFRRNTLARTKTIIQSRNTILMRKKPSQWEWIPVGVMLLLALIYFFVAKPDGTLARFSLIVGLSLAPGCAHWIIKRKNSWHIHRICFALGLLTFVLNNPGLRPDKQTLLKVVRNWPLVLLGIAISFTQPIWGALRTWRLLDDSGIRISGKNVLKMSLTGNFFNMILPGSTGGDAYRIFAIKQGARTKLGAAIASITLDRLLGLPSLIFVVVIGMVLDYNFFKSNHTLSKMIPFIEVVGAICLALVIYLWLAGRYHRKQLRMIRAEENTDEPKQSRIHRLNAMIATNVKSPATLPLALLYGLLAHLACVASCQTFGNALEVGGVPPLGYLLIVPMVMTINGIPGAPGGVGQGELAMAALLDLASPGVDNAQAGVMVMLLFRLSNLLIGVLGGVLYAFGKVDFHPEDAPEPDPWP